MRVPRSCPVLLAAVLTGTLLTGCGGTAATSPSAVTTASTGSAGSAVSGSVHLGPTCPVVRPGAACADRPAPGVAVSVMEAAGPGRSFARATTDRDGDFGIVVPPGDYVVTAAAGMSCPAVAVHVDAGATAHVDVACDSGIR